MPRVSTIGLLQIGEKYLRIQSAVGEDDRLQLARKHFFRHASRFIDIAAPNAEITVHHRRVVENENLLSGRGAILFDNFDFLFDEL